MYRAAPAFDSVPPSTVSVSDSRVSRSTQRHDDIGSTTFCREDFDEERLIDVSFNAGPLKREGTNRWSSSKNVVPQFGRASENGKSRSTVLFAAQDPQKQLQSDALSASESVSSP